MNHKLVECDIQFDDKVIRGWQCLQCHQIWIADCSDMAVAVTEECEAALDVKPVVTTAALHAMWINSRFHRTLNRMQKQCSNCCAWSAEFTRPYCSNCGASMDIKE